jgi:FixJ family two-component response regulator
MNSMGATVFFAGSDRSWLAEIEPHLNSDPRIVEIPSHTKDFRGLYDPSEPSCVIVDLGKEGTVFHRELAREALPVPVILVCPADDAWACCWAMNRGMAACVKKPFEIPLLAELVDEAIESDRRRCLLDRRRRGVQRRLDSLTAREREVMRKLLHGASPKRIAADLGIGAQTVAKHRSRGLEKLRVDNEFELIHLLLEHEIDPRKVWDSEPFR